MNHNGSDSFQCGQLYPGLPCSSAFQSWIVLSYEHKLLHRIAGTLLSGFKLTVWCAICGIHQEEKLFLQG